MILQVTDEHIRNGKKGNCLTCPIALCFKEYFAEVKITRDAVFVIDEKKPTKIHLDETIREWIDSFDNAGRYDMNPKTYPIRIVIPKDGKAFDADRKQSKDKLKFYMENK